MNNDIKDWKCSKFGERLIEALKYLDVEDEKQQVKKVAIAAGVTISTAKKYLILDKCPMNNYPSRLLSLANALNIDHRWLYDGTGLSPINKRIKDAMNEMPDWQKNKMLRLAIRLLNNDQKVQRLIKLFDEGFISHAHFLSEM